MHTCLPTTMPALTLEGTTPRFEPEFALPPFNTATDALVRVQLAGICNTDVELIQGYMGFQGVLGHEFVGVVEQCPSDPQWVGKRVCVDINAACEQASSPNHCNTCGHPHHCPSRTVVGIVNHHGGFAQYVHVPVRNLYEVPANVTNEQAVFTEPLAAAFEILEQRPLYPHERVLVLGDGKLGLLIAMALATATPHVTLVGKHASKLAVVEGLPIATHLLSHDWPNDWKEHWDVVVEATGSARGLVDAMMLTKPRGTIVLKSTVALGAEVNLFPIVVNELTVLGSRCGPFDVALNALATGQLPVERLIQARYPLSQGVEALTLAQQKGMLKVLLEI